MRKIKTVSIIPYKLYPSQKYSQSQGSQLKQSDGESTNKKFVFIQQGRYPHYRYYPTLLLPKGVAVCCRTEIEVTFPAHRRESDSSYTIQSTVFLSYTIQCTVFYANPTTPAKY